MRILVVANDKGGVGKTATSTQFSYCLALLMKQRVPFLDLDHQRNSSKTIAKSGKAVVSQKTTLDVLQHGAIPIEAGDFVLVPAHKDLQALVDQGKGVHNAIASNLMKFLSSVEDRFDVCVIDTNGAPDIRRTAALCCAQYVVSPIQLNQEAIDGIGDLMGNIKRIQRINPKLQLIGILPNMVEAKPFQKANFEQIVKHFPQLLIMTEPGSQDFAHIPMRSIIPEAQAEGLPIWEIKKTAARDAWRELEKYFTVIAARMEINARMEVQ